MTANMIERASGLVIPRPPDLREYAKRQQVSLVQALGVVIDEHGKQVHTGEWSYNALSNLGQKEIERVYLGGGANTTKYAGLANQGNLNAIAKTVGSTSGITEAATPGSDGYVRQQLLTTDWTDNGIQPSDNQFTAAEKTFGPFTGSAKNLSHMLMCVDSSGASLLICTVPLSALTTVAVGQSFKLIIKWVVT